MKPWGHQLEELEKSFLLLLLLLLIIVVITLKFMMVMIQICHCGWNFKMSRSGSGLIPSPSAKPESIAAINGIIAFGNVAGTVNSGQAGVLKLDFIGDAAYRYMESGSSSYSGKWSGGGLANRNTGTSTSGSWDNTLGYIVDNDVNDVAMTVLPNAPIDSATGLPVPTIAVATDDGVSVIKDDGTVVDHMTVLGENLHKLPLHKMVN